MKPTFLGKELPTLTLMIFDVDTPEKFIEEIEMGKRDGAEAFGLQLEMLKREYRTEEILREIFDLDVFRFGYMSLVCFFHFSQ